jgi:hypothetical protein
LWVHPTTAHNRLTPSVRTLVDTWHDNVLRQEIARLSSLNPHFASLVRRYDHTDLQRGGDVFMRRVYLRLRTGVGPWTAFSQRNSALRIPRAAGLCTHRNQ